LTERGLNCRGYKEEDRRGAPKGKNWDRHRAFQTGWRKNEKRGRKSRNSLSVGKQGGALGGRVEKLANKAHENTKRSVSYGGRTKRDRRKLYIGFGPNLLSIKEEKRIEILFG